MDTLDVEIVKPDENVAETYLSAPDPNFTFPISFPAFELEDPEGMASADVTGFDLSGATVGIGSASIELSRGENILLVILGAPVQPSTLEVTMNVVPMAPTIGAIDINVQGLAGMSSMSFSPMGGPSFTFPVTLAPFDVTGLEGVVTVDANGLDAPGGSVIATGTVTTMIMTGANTVAVTLM